MKSAVISSLFLNNFYDGLLLKTIIIAFHLITGCMALCGHRCVYSPSRLSALADKGRKETLFFFLFLFLTSIRFVLYVNNSNRSINSFSSQKQISVHSATRPLLCSLSCCPHLKIYAFLILNSFCHRRCSLVDFS